MLSYVTMYYILLFVIYLSIYTLIICNTMMGSQAKLCCHITWSWSIYTVYVISSPLTSSLLVIGEGLEQHAAVFTTDHLQSTESHWPVCCSCQTVQLGNHEDHWQICTGLCAAYSFCCLHSEHQSLQWFILVCLSQFKRLWRQRIPCVFEFLHLFSIACGCVCSNGQWIFGSMYLSVWKAWELFAFWGTFEEL